MLESLVSHYCIFFRDNRIEFGWIEKIQKNKALVVPLQGKSQFLPANRIVFSWKDKKLPSNSSMAQKLINIHINEAKKFKDTCEIETMHSLLDEVREYSLDELSGSFLNDPKNSIYRLGLFIALREDSFWFKHNRNLTYTPRTNEELEQLKIQLLKQGKIKENTSKIQKWIKEIEAGEWLKEHSISSEKKDLILKLKNLITDGSNSIYWKEMSLILNLGSSLAIFQEKKILKWLSQAGFPVNWSNLILLRAQVKEFFSKEILNEIKRIKSEKSYKNKFFNPDTPTFSIDSKKTLDYDDAFSIIEWNKRGLKIAVHITDLSISINKNDPLFKEAESRISSVYTVDAYFPMFPKELSNNIFSLKSGEFRNVISFYFNLTINGNWDFLKIDSQKIKVQKNLTYEEANKLIEENKDFWEVLSQACIQSQKKRMEKGALNISRKEFLFDIRDPKHILITSQKRNSPANKIVEELAITVNRTTGNLFQKSKFPGIYRTQASYEIIKEVENGKDFTMENVRINPTKLSTIPDKHAGLGCELYMQATSPMRRFSDLVIQMQLKLILEQKKPIFSEEDMISWAEKISTRQKKYKRAETEILNFWKLIFLEQNLEDVFLAKTRKTLSNGNIEIELIELDLTIACSGVEKHAEGENILIQIISVDKKTPKLVVKSVKNLTERKI